MQVGGKGRNDVSTLAGCGVEFANYIRVILSMFRTYARYHLWLSAPALRWG
jgi:hypothetical protein